MTNTGALTTQGGVAGIAMAPGGWITLQSWLGSSTNEGTLTGRVLRIDDPWDRCLRVD